MRLWAVPVGTWCEYLVETIQLNLITPLQTEEKEAIDG